MLRTQIYLPEELHYQLACLAKLQETSVSEIIRNSVKKTLVQKNYQKKKSFSQFLNQWIKDGKKYGKKLPKDFSTRHTEYYLETVLKNH